MKRGLTFSVLLAVAACCVALPLWAAIGDFTLLHEYAGGAGDGSTSYDQGVVVDGATIYGAALQGGANNAGVIFKENTDGTGYALLHQFDGAAGGWLPSCITVSGTVVYGTTKLGGANNEGTIFKMNTDGSAFAVIHDFGGAADGRRPHYGSPAIAGTVLYGVTLYGGTADRGTVWKINTDGTGYQKLYDFLGGAGNVAYPWEHPTVSGGVIYGMSSNGGPADMGTVWKMNTDGTGFALVYSFPGPNAVPYGTVKISSTTLYGHTSWGGINGLGSIFKVNTDGSGYAILHDFAGGPGDGRVPSGSPVISGDRLYGMTALGGTNDRGIVYSIKMDGTGYQVLRNFAGGGNDGGIPYGGSPAVANGVLYGQTVQGGDSDIGVVFKLQVANPPPPPPPVPQCFIGSLFN